MFDGRNVYDSNKSLILDTSEHVTEILSAQTVVEISSVLRNATGMLGFDTFNISVGKKDGTDFMLNPTITTWSGEDLERYVRDGWLEKDPLLKYSAGMNKPIMWNVSDFYYKSNVDYFYYLKSLGIHDGLTIPLSSQKGDRGAMSMLSTHDVISNPDTLHAATILANVAKTQIAIIGAEATEKSTIYSPIHSLSDIQLDILQWISRGKSNFDISVILGRSKRSVDYHVSELIRKLNVSSRTEASAIYVKEMSK